MSFIYFLHISTVFVASNNKNTSNFRKVHAKKLANLCSNNNYFESVTSPDPEKVLYNFSKNVPIVHEKSLL